MCHSHGQINCEADFSYLVSYSFDPVRVISAETNVLKCLNQVQKAKFLSQVNIEKLKSGPIPDFELAAFKKSVINFVGTMYGSILQCHCCDASGPITCPLLDVQAVFFGSCFTHSFHSFQFFVSILQLVVSIELCHTNLIFPASALTIAVTYSYMQLRWPFSVDYFPIF